MKKTADVVIIGGGCMGASVAYHLARRGVTDVALVEREPLLGMGSTGRNAGGVRHQFSSEANVRLSIESIRLLEKFKDEVGYEIDFHQDGYLFLLSSADSLDLFRRSVQMQRGLGVEVDIISPDEAKRLAPGLELQGVHGATYCSRDGIADPNGLTQGFAKAALAAGVNIYRDTEVASVMLNQERVAGVLTSKGNISAPVVVNAAGPYARSIGAMAGLDIPVFPFRRHIFITEPVADGARAPANRIMVIDFESTFYFHREGAGILFGMSDPDEASTTDLTVKWELLEKITPIAVRRLPVLSEAGIARAWAGLYEMTPDAMPIIGPAPAPLGFFMINGFSGHGFQHSPAAGRILADLIVDGQAPGDNITAFTFERFSAPLTDPEANVV